MTKTFAISALVLVAAIAYSPAHVEPLSPAQTFKQAQAQPIGHKRAAPVTAATARPVDDTAGASDVRTATAWLEDHLAAQSTFADRRVLRTDR